MYKWDSKKGHSFSGLHITVFQTEIQPSRHAQWRIRQRATKVETSIFSLIVKVAIKVLNNFQINSKLVWECQKSLVKLSEHNMVQLILVPGNTGIDGNETADQLARKGSSYPLTGLEPAFGISTKVVKGVIRDWKHEEIWLSIHE